MNNAYVNNEYVQLKDPYPDEFQADEYVDIIVIENITAEYNRSAPSTATNNLKVGDIFESKVKLLQAISERSIIRSVSYKSVKTNRTCYTTVCGANDAGGKEYLGDFMPQSQKIQVNTSRLKVFDESIHAICRYFNPIIVKQRHPLCAITLCL